MASTPAATATATAAAPTVNTTTTTTSTSTSTITTTTITNTTPTTTVTTITTTTTPSQPALDLAAPTDLCAATADTVSSENALMQVPNAAASKHVDSSGDHHIAPPPKVSQLSSTRIQPCVTTVRATSPGAADGGVSILADGKDEKGNGEKDSTSASGRGNLSTPLEVRGPTVKAASPGEALKRVSGKAGVQNDEKNKPSTTTLDRTVAARPCAPTVKGVSSGEQLGISTLEAKLQDNNDEFDRNRAFSLAIARSLIRPALVPKSSGASVTANPKQVVGDKDTKKKAPSTNLSNLSTLTQIRPVAAGTASSRNVQEKKPKIWRLGEISTENRKLLKAAVFPILALPEKVRKEIYQYLLAPSTKIYLVDIPVEPAGTKGFRLRGHQTNYMLRSTVGRSTYIGTAKQGNVHGSTGVHTAILRTSEDVYHEARTALYGRRIIFACSAEGAVAWLHDHGKHLDSVQRMRFHFRTTDTRETRRWTPLQVFVPSTNLHRFRTLVNVLVHSCTGLRNFRLVVDAGFWLDGVWKLGVVASFTATPYFREMARLALFDFDRSRYQSSNVGVDINLYIADVAGTPFDLAKWRFQRAMRANIYTERRMRPTIAVTKRDCLCGTTRYEDCCFVRIPRKG